MKRKLIFVITVVILVLVTSLLLNPCLETMTIIHDYSGTYVTNFKHENWDQQDSNRN